MLAYCLTRQKPNMGPIQPVRRQCAGLQRLFCLTLLPLKTPNLFSSGAGLVADDEVNYKEPIRGEPIRKTPDCLLRLCRRSTTSLRQKAANSPTQKIHCKDQSSDSGKVGRAKPPKFLSHSTSPTRPRCHPGLS